MTSLIHFVLQILLLPFFKFIFLEPEVMKMTEYSTLTGWLIKLNNQTVQVKCRYTDIC